MTQERVIQSFTTDPHLWEISAIDDGKIWITINNTKYLFSIRDCVKLSLQLLRLTVNVSDYLDPFTESKPIEASKETDS